MPLKQPDDEHGDVGRDDRDFFGKKRMRDPKIATEGTKNRGRERIG
jgi:hypothetical protein